jgi:hypothetical protein
VLDVVVIGGGPAGSTCSTLLAQHGCRVLEVSDVVFWSQIIALPGIARNLLTILSERMRQDNVEFFFSKLVFHGTEVRELGHLETGSELVPDDFEIVGDDSDEMPAAVLEFVRRIVGFGTDSNDRMRRQPFFFLSREIDECRRAGRLGRRNCADGDYARCKAGCRNRSNQPALARPQRSHWHLLIETVRHAELSAKFFPSGRPAMQSSPSGSSRMHDLLTRGPT